MPSTIRSVGQSQGRDRERRAAVVPPGPEAGPPADAGPRRRRRWPRVVLGIVVVALLAFVLAVAWWLQPQPLLPEATAALASSPAVEFRDEAGWLGFVPRAGDARTALVFYSGGKVEPAAYAPAAQAIAAAGYPVFIAEMPLNLAVLAPDAAAAIIRAIPGSTAGCWPATRSAARW